MRGQAKEKLSAPTVYGRSSSEIRAGLSDMLGILRPARRLGDEPVEDGFGFAALVIRALGMPLHAEQELLAACILDRFDDPIVRALRDHTEAFACDRDGLVMAGVHRDANSGLFHVEQFETRSYLLAFREVEIQTARGGRFGVAERLLGGRAEPNYGRSNQNCSTWNIRPKIGAGF